MFYDFRNANCLKDVTIKVVLIDTYYRVSIKFCAVAY